MMFEMFHCDFCARTEILSVTFLLGSQACVISFSGSQLKCHVLQMTALWNILATPASSRSQLNQSLGSSTINSGELNFKILAFQISRNSGNLVKMYQQSTKQRFSKLTRNQDLKPAIMVVFAESLGVTAVHYIDAALVVCVQLVWPTVQCIQNYWHRNTNPPQLAACIAAATAA